MNRLFISTSIMATWCFKGTRKISGLTENDISNLLDRFNKQHDEFPLMMASDSNVRDQSFIDRFQQPVLFANNEEMKEGSTDGLLVVNANESSLYIL